MSTSPPASRSQFASHEQIFWPEMGLAGGLVTSLKLMGQELLICCPVCGVHSEQGRLGPLLARHWTRARGAPNQRLALNQLLTRPPPTLPETVCGYCLSGSVCREPEQQTYRHGQCPQTGGQSVSGSLARPQGECRPGLQSCLWGRPPASLMWPQQAQFCTGCWTEEPAHSWLKEEAAVGSWPWEPLDRENQSMVSCLCPSE